MTLLVELLIIFISSLISVWFYFKQSFWYWKKRNVLYIEPKIPFGSLGNPFWDKKGITMRLKEAYDKFKTEREAVGGIYMGSKPVLLAVSLETVKTILHTAFEHFDSQGNTFDEETEPLGAHLLNLSGQRWKEMRVKLTPTFTSAKMKMMFQTVLDCGKQLEEHFGSDYQGKKWVNIKETVACFTTDVICSCAFGVDCNSLKNPDTEFRLYGKKAFEGNLKTVLRRYGNIICPGIIKALKIPLFDTSSTDFFMDTIQKIVTYRKLNKVTRNDFVQILLDIEGDGFTLGEIAAQAFVFFLAGFETSSTTMTFCLYELAHYPDIQEKLRVEINCAIKNHGGELTYKSITEMKYLDQVINETLRKYPPLPVLKRLCTKDFKLPNGTIMEKGNIVYLSILGLHRDEEYYPHPDQFDPDRFSDINKIKIPPYAFIPFGEGPRMCIGLRFGKMQVKVGICSILKRYKISPHETMTYPIEFEPKNFMLNSKGPVLLNFEAINE